MCCKWMIIVAHSCMISSDYEVAAAKILPHYCMMNCLFGPSIAHICVESHKHHHLLWVIAVYQRKIGRKNQFIFKVTLFFLTNERVDKKTIVEIKSCLL